MLISVDGCLSRGYSDQVDHRPDASSSCLHPVDRHLEFGHVLSGTVVVPLQIQLPAVAGEPVATVLDPAHQRLIHRLDGAHSPAVQDGCHFDAGKLNHLNRATVADGLAVNVEPSVQHDTSVVVGILITGDREVWSGTGSIE